MNTKQIDDILKRTCCHYRGTFARDELMKQHFSFRDGRDVYLVVNSDPASKLGTHWYAIYLSPSGEGFFFDSFGRHNIPSHFKKWMFRHCKCWSYSAILCQSIMSDKCGEFCIMFILYMCKYNDFEKLASVLTNDTMLNNKIVDQFINSLL